MLSAWRLTKTKLLASAWDGQGARKSGGRWNSIGIAVVYASGTLSLALVEGWVDVVTATATTRLPKSGAIAESVRAPEVARALDSIGGETGRAALRAMMTHARSSGLLSGEPIQMAEQFAGLLWGNLFVSLLLRVADPPHPREITRRARMATAAFLQLYPQPDELAAARRP